MRRLQLLVAIAILACVGGCGRSWTNWWRPCSTCVTGWDSSSMTTGDAQGALPGPENLPSGNR